MPARTAVFHSDRAGYDATFANDPGVADSMRHISVAAERVATY